MRGFGMNKMINMLKNVNLSSLKNEKSLDDLIEMCKQEGRVEGAKTELQNCIKDLEASLEFYECDYGKLVDKVIEELNENINKFKKCLKDLESKGVN
jgi:hypothetical protein